VLDELDDFQLLCGRISHSSSSRSPITLYFEKTVFQGRIGNHLLERHGLVTQIVTSSEVAARALRSQALLAPREPPTATQLGNAVLANPLFNPPVLSTEPSSVKR
jgi:hypothetical protein